MKKLITLVVLLVSSTYIFSQCSTKPTINSFTPNTGFIGSTVTITGANFDATTISNNKVFFGATQAVVQSANFGQLVVTVPVGATTSRIAVTNQCNLTAYSSVPFNGIFCPTPLTSGTYANTDFNLTGIYGAYNMLAVDMDLDGKPEVVSSSNGGNLTIAKNNSTPGNLSFSGINLAGKGGQAIYTADLDGDGRQDLISTYNSFLNTSSGPGNISIGNAISNQSVSTYQSAAGDFNNDGKIDIVGEDGNIIYIGRNLSTGVGNASFSARQSIHSVGGRATGLQAADIDGDGKIDIIGSQRNNNRAFTLRNVTPDGATTFSFEAPEFWSVGGTEPYRCQIADFNKDGKMDFTTCNYSGTFNTAVIINRSTPGDIIMNELYNLPSFNNNYRIQVGDVDGDGYPDIVSKSLGFNLFAVYRNTTTGPNNVSFAPRIDYSSSAQAEVSGIVIGDLDGDFVPDIATSGISSNAIRFHRNSSFQQDNTPPTAICQNINIGLDPSGNATITPSMVDNGSSDACGIDNITLSKTTFTCADIGDNYVTLFVTDLAGNTDTCGAIVNVQPAAIIVAGQTTVCSGQTISISANPGDSYQWRKDGIDLPGEINQTFTATVSGDYTVVVTNAGGCSGESVTTTLTINNGSNVSISPANATITCGSPTTLTASNAALYQWQLNGANIPGANIQTYAATQAGQYSVQVIDIFGCPSTSAAITVSNGPPIASVMDATVYLGANGNLNLSISDIDDGTVANCPNGTVTLSPSTFDCSNIGSNIVTVTVTDANGNSDTASAVVTVIDSTGPLTILQPGTIYLDSNGQAIITASDIDNGTSDACGIATTSVSPINFDCSNLGQGSSSSSEVPLNYIGFRNINHRSYGGGFNPNTNQFHFPEWSGNRVYITDPISGALIQTKTLPTNQNMQTWIDNSSTDVYSANWGNNTISRYDGNTLVWSYNVGTLAANVTTDDNYVYTQPYNSSEIRVLNKANGTLVNSFNLPGRMIVYGGLVYSNDKLYIFGIAYFGNVQGTWNAVHTFDAVNGNYLQSQSLPHPTYFGASFDGEVAWIGNGSRIEGYQIASGSAYSTAGGARNVVAFSATDVNGNTSYDTTFVSVVDTIAPVINSNNTTVYLDANGSSSISLADVENGSSDNCAIETIELGGNSTFNCSNLGSNSVTITATDSSGNTSTKNQTVTVLDTIAPIAVAQNISVFLDASRQVSITAADINGGSSDNCSISSIAASQTTFDCNEKGNTVNVTLTVTDQSGNTSNAIAQVSVIDNGSFCNQAPVAVCQNITVYTGLNCDASIISTDLDGGSTDPDGDALSYSLSTSGPFTVGTHTVGLTVNDGELSDNCTATVTVIDTTAPVALTQNVTVQLDANGNGSITAADIDNGSNDACGFTLAIDNSTFTCANVGTNTVTLTVTDANNNVSSATSVVSVADNVAPNALTQNITVQLDASGNASIVAADIDNGSNDACGIASLALDVTSFDCSNVGANTVTLTVTDVNNNVSTQTATVTVEDNIAPTAVCQNVTLQLDASGQATILGANSTVNVFNEQFQTDANAGNSALLNNWNVLAGNVDVNNFTSGTGREIDMGGNTNATIETKNSITLVPGDYEFSFHHQTNSNPNPNNQLNIQIGSFLNETFPAPSSVQQVTRSFTVTTATTVTIRMQELGTNDNSGTFIGDINLSREVVGSLAIENGSSDDCGIASITASRTSFTCSDIGTNNVTLTVTDVNGNSSTCVATVTVEDNISPVITCSPNITINSDAVTCGTVVNYAEPTATDNCGFGTGGGSNVLIIWDVINANTTSLKNALIADGLNVTMSATSEYQYNGSNPSLSGFDAVIHLNGSTYGQTMPLSGQNALVDFVINQGKTYITEEWSAYEIDSRNAMTAMRDIVVLKRNSGTTGSYSYTTVSGQAGHPILSGLSNSFTLPTGGSNIGIARPYSSNPATVLMTGTTIGDAVVVRDFANGGAAVAFAHAGNYANLSILSDANVQKLYINAARYGSGSTAITQIAGLPAGATFPIGTTVNTFVAVDSSGNSDTCTFNVTVNDVQAPNMVANSMTVVLVDRNTYTLSQSEIDQLAANSSDNCAVNYTISNHGFDCSTVGQTVSLTLTGTDASGNSANVQVSVTVTDPNSVCNDPPVAACQNITLYTGSNCDASIAATDVDGGSSDPDGDVLTYTVDNSGAFGVGTHTVTLTVSDGEYSDACTATVTVLDSTAPITLTQNVTVQLDANGNGSITTADIDNGSNDACGIASLALDVTSFDCSNVGANTVTLTSTDVNGNSSSATATVTVEDNVDPITLTQNVTVQLDANGNGTITTADIDNGSNDACGIASLSLDNTSFTCANVGANTVILTSTDVNGNSSSASVTVTVEDNVAPTAIAQDITVQLDANGNGSITTADIDNGSNDACGIASLALDVTSFDCSNVGANTVTLTSTDVNGNSSSAAAIVTVEDNVDPITLTQNVTVQLDANGNGSITTADIDNGSNDACGIASLALDVTSFDCSNVGANTVTLTSTDVNGNSSSAAAIVTVEDNVDPITLTQNVTVQLDANGNGSITTADIDNGSNDACGIASLSLDNTSFTCANVGANTVILTSTDVNGNSSSASATVTVEDNVAPTAIAQDITVQLDANGNGSITTADIDNGSNDACGIASLALDVTSFDCSNVGANTVTLTSTDVNGNSSSAAAIVTVEDNVDPITLTQNVTVQLDANGNGSITTADIDNGSNDACGIASLALDVTSFDCSNVGANTVTLTSTDVNGNSSSAAAIVTVEDNVDPITLTQNVTVQLDANGNGSITTADIDNGSNDACGIASLALDVTSFDCSNVGANTVTLTSTDVNGNSSSATAIVTVEDNVDPITLTQNVTVQLDANGNGSITTADIDNGSNDACGIASLALDVTSFDCSNVGANTVTLTSTDVNGNSSSATATVTVEDNVDPIALCQNVTVTLANGVANITPQMVDNGSNDACGIASLSVDVDSWDCNDIGDHPVVLTVTDNNGNSSTCNAMVTVVGEVPTCSITSVPTNNTYTGGVNTTLYLGYGAQSTVLDVAASGGSSFTYAWTGQNLSSTTSANPTFTPTAEGKYTFDVLVTNEFGCETSCSITICVRDIRVRKKNGSIQNGKVYLCHVPPGKPNKTLTLSISVNAVASHLTNHSGDALGVCGSTCNDVAVARKKETTIVDAEDFYHNHDIGVILYPNPTKDIFNLEFDDEFDSNVDIEIRSINGKLIRKEQVNGLSIQGKLSFDMSNQANGIYFISIRRDDFVKVIKFSKM